MSQSDLSLETHTHPPNLRHWRAERRRELIARRLALDSKARRALSIAISRELDHALLSCESPIVSAYWPFRGEPNLMAWLAKLHSRCVRVALPVVVAKGQPLEFREWHPGAPLQAGIWNIPIPVSQSILEPSVVIAPLVGFDREGYRLGYGGGFFDRTLASLSRKPLVIGVGHDCLEMSTIHPQAHDVPMDLIVTGNGSPRDHRKA